MATMMDGISPLLVEGLFKTAEMMKNLKDASTEITEFAEELEILSGVLIQFQEALETTIPSIVKANEQQSEYKTAKQLATRFQRTIDKMRMYGDLAPMVTKDSGLLQQLLARLKWLRGKSNIATARQTVQMLSSMAGLFLSSLTCKSHFTQIAELQERGAEVPLMLSLKLTNASKACQREERRMESASDRLDCVDKRTLTGIGLRVRDIRKLQRIGEKTTKTAMSAVDEAQRYTRATSSPQSQSGSSYGRLSADFLSSRSTRSASPQVTLAPQSSRSRSSRVESSPPTPQPQAHKDTPTYFSDTSQPGATVLAAGPPRAMRRSRIHRPRVRDKGKTVMAEESEWPAEKLGNYEHLTTPSQDSVASPEHTNGEHPSNVKEPQSLRRSSSIVSQGASIHEQRAARGKQMDTPRFGEQYKPCGLFTESDREERNRRGSSSVG